MQSMDNNIDNMSEKFPGIDYAVGVGNVLGDDSLFEEILIMFYEDHASDGEKLETGIKENDTVSLKHIAHTLKGVACSVGAMSLFDATKLLDIAINEQKNDQFESLFIPVRIELDKVIKGIEMKLSSRL